jgi:hypothetical protein
MLWAAQPARSTRAVRRRRGGGVRSPIGRRSVSMSVRGSMPDTDRGKDRRLPAAAGKWSSAAPNGAADRAACGQGRVAIQVRRCEHDVRHPKPKSPPQDRAIGQGALGGHATSLLFRRTSVRQAGSEGELGAGGHNAGIFLQRARSARGCLGQFEQQLLRFCRLPRLDRVVPLCAAENYGGGVMT